MPSEDVRCTRGSDGGVIRVADCKAYQRTLQSHSEKSAQRMHLSERQLYSGSAQGYLAGSWRPMPLHVPFRSSPGGFICEYTKCCQLAFTVCPLCK